MLNDLRFTEIETNKTARLEFPERNSVHFRLLKLLGCSIHLKRPFRSWIGSLRFSEKSENLPASYAWPKLYVVFSVY